MFDIHVIKDGERTILDKRHRQLSFTLLLSLSIGALLRRLVICIAQTARAPAIDRGNGFVRLIGIGLESLCSVAILKLAVLRLTPRHNALRLCYRLDDALFQYRYVLTVFFSARAAIGRAHDD